jgi:divalent metal cation (Fe/Co/Zn/Cd) transporter
MSAQVTQEIMAVPGIHRVERVRVRESGPRTFIEATVRIDQFITLEQGHRLTDIAEERIKTAIPSSDVILHAEPICLEDATLEDRIRAEASTMAEIKSVHNIAFTEGHSGRVVELHIELDGDLTVEAADELAKRLEEKIRGLDPCIHLVASHIEPVGCPACEGEASEIKQDIVEKTLNNLAAQFPEVLACRDLHVHATKNGLRVFLCCQFDPQMSVARAHELVHILEGHIRSQHDEIENVTIRLEPSCSICSKGGQGPSGDHKGTLW